MAAGPLAREVHVESLKAAYARALRAEQKARGRLDRAERHWRACRRRTAEALAALRASGPPGRVP